MRLVTFNIRNGAAADGEHAWPERKGRFLPFLRELNADVLCLQEVFDFQLDEIAASLADYDFVGVGRDDGSRAGEFAPIFFRGLKLAGSGTMWLSETPSAPGSMAWGARLPRICTWAKFEGFTVANLHMDHEALEARTRGAQLVLESLEANIVCGDFNAQPDEPAISAMLQAGYVDCGAREGGTYNDFCEDVQQALRIDYVFVRPPLSAIAEVRRRPLVSDHWPLIADIS